jgi:hypothetical protein
MIIKSFLFVKILTQQIPGMGIFVAINAKVLPIAAVSRVI